MRTLLSWLGLLGTLALAGMPAPAGAQPVGEEFQVNTYTTEYQEYSSLASDASGNFVVVWHSRDQDGSRLGVFGQRYNREGVPQGNEFRVNSYTTGHQRWPSVASDANGNFVVVWTGTDQDGDEHYGIIGQRYDSGGVALGGEFHVNTVTTSDQKVPSVASDASGNFVVVWVGVDDHGSGPYPVSTDGIFGQRYNSEGVPQGDEFRVNSYTTDHQHLPSMASDTNGNFVVVWRSRGGQDGDDSGIFGQRYDSTGGVLGGEFRVNSYTTDHQSLPSVASDTDGNFVVVWSSYDGQDGDKSGIFGQRYDSTGGTLGGEFQVNAYTTSQQNLPSVASDASGNFIVAWASRGQDGDDFGIFGQRYDSEGVAQGDEFQINSYTTNYQALGSSGHPVGPTGTNQFVVTWASRGQDGDDFGIFGQRYDFGGAQAVTVVSPNTEVRWRIGALERIQWTQNLGLAATFRIDLDRDDDGDYEELIAAAAPVDSATKGSFAWTVIGPRSGEARVRVSWTDDLSVSDSSDVTFQIRPVGLD